MLLLSDCVMRVQCGNIAEYVQRRCVRPGGQQAALLTNIWARAATLNSIDLVREGGSLC